jgi:hypothetical protein
MSRGEPMRLLRQARSNPLAWWWALLALGSSANIALWFMMYHQYASRPSGSRASAFDPELMLFLCAAYVFGCAFRSFLPRADLQRICLFNTWLSSIVVGRSVATVAEVCFATQSAIVLYQLGDIAGVGTTLSIAWAIVPLILIAQVCSWYAVLTTNPLASAIENSIWAIAFLGVGLGLSRLLPEFDGLVRVALVVGIAGIAGYLAFLMTIDIPMYLSRWHAGRAAGRRPLTPLEGLRDASTRWIVTHDFKQWKDEIAWMSLYFTAAVWASLALCIVYSLGDQLPRYRAEPAAINSPTSSP